VANIALSARAPGDHEFEGQEASVGFEVPSAHAAVENMKRVELAGLYLTGHELQASGGTPRMPARSALPASSTHNNEAVVNRKKRSRRAIKFNFGPKGGLLFSH
jgi:hypothetical protein